MKNRRKKERGEADDDNDNYDYDDGGDDGIVGDNET
jgi:hypothetical protein